MLICQKCGRKLPDTAKFCDGCGAYIEKAVPQTILNECPNCGSAIGDSVAMCPYCQSQIPGRTISEWLREFFDKVDRAKSQKEKIEIIKIFPVPNTKEGILEFMIMACSNFDAQDYVDNLAIDDISDAWLAKIEQCYQKAKICFEGDSCFYKIEYQYEKIKSRCAELKEKAKQEEQAENQKKAVEKFKESKLRIVLIVLLCLSAALIFTAFTSVDILSGIMSLFAFVLLLVAFLIKNGTIKGKGKKEDTIIMIIGMCLLFVAFMNYGYNTTSIGSL